MTFGILVLFPIFLIIFLANLVLGVLVVWDVVFKFVPIFAWLHTPTRIVLTLLSCYLVGLAVTSERVDWLFSRIPIVKNLWGIVKNIVDRIVFASQGGHKIVLYNGYDKNSVRKRPGVVLGKTTVEDVETGDKQTLLVVMQPPPNVFDSLLIPPEDTKVVVGEKRQIVLYMFSGGIINQARIRVRPWKSGEHNEIPEGDTTPEDPSVQDEKY